MTFTLLDFPYTAPTYIPPLDPNDDTTIDDDTTVDDEPNVIDGDDTSEELVGTAWNDVIDGYAGDDILYGEDGDDDLYGGDGNDDLYGGDGFDILQGADSIDFGAGEIDYLTGGAGSDGFILGSTEQAFYVEEGADDFAIIDDYSLAEDDLIVVYGTAEDYELVTLDDANAVGIFYQGEAIGVVLENLDLSLSTDFYFFN
jgi:Ca2+-binding RTX toxin-like protein